MGVGVQSAAMTSTISNKRLMSSFAMTWRMIEVALLHRMASNLELRASRVTAGR